MKLYETTMSQLHNPVPARVAERGELVVGLIECRGGTLELTREELIAFGSACRELVQLVDAALDRRAQGVRPIPVHGQPARPYAAVPAGLAAAAALPTTLAPPGAHLTPLARHAAPPVPPLAPVPAPADGRQEQVVPDPPAAATAS
ncbi:hypothetical protein HCN51_31670 [Nonomuraea sp. FMUSA5-5]|uniref:Uncharacterized protein n=1 Tax=Nonomuraea composti TaxID=2720023 RepID=A0ABX1BC37_9ACTN|nr:hypothetical protein [Nonomuraea sp. FMUSA5-5]NJP93944.1 hypothetical protein [Nonomuraea sp. FMUSA5-5]